MNTTAYFRKAEDYAAYRLQYADESICALLNITGLDACWIVADIGSGTGNVTKHLVGRVRRVFAVEPDKAMRHQAEQLLADNPSFRSIAGTAEQTTLPSQSLNLITVGQALHWFDQSAAKAEFERVLKPNRWVALIWNRFGPPIEPDMTGFLSPDECRRRSFPVILKETWLQFIGGARSAANNPSQGDDGYEEYEHQQRRIFDAQAIGGLITIEYMTELAVGRLNRRTNS